MLSSRIFFVECLQIDSAKFTSMVMRNPRITVLVKMDDKFHDLFELA
jgi:hypothetical protein